MILQGREALEELINDKLSSNDISQQHKEELLKMVTDHFEKPKKKGSRFERRSSERSSNGKQKSSDAEVVETKKEKSDIAKEAGEISEKLSEFAIKDDIIKPITNQANAVEVN